MERCLACEAVAVGTLEALPSRGRGTRPRRAGRYRSREAFLRAGSIVDHPRRTRQFVGPVGLTRLNCAPNPRSNPYRAQLDKRTCITISPCSPRPRKRGSAPRSPTAHLSPITSHFSPITSHFSPSPSPTPPLTSEQLTYSPHPPYPSRRYQMRYRDQPKYARLVNPPSR